ncbi:MAG: zinc finger domain-containing protein [Rubrivivax sp.]
MPDLPAIEIVLRAQEHLIGQVLSAREAPEPPSCCAPRSPPLPAPKAAASAASSIDKRIVLALPACRRAAEQPDLWLVIHLMIAGRLRPAGAGRQMPPGRITLALLEFDAGTLVLTEAGSKRRASLHLVDSRAALAALDAGGVDVAQLDAAAFTQRLKQENHTLKRALTDPRLFSGIGNAYSDEILHRARLSPLALTKTLPEGDALRLHEAALAVLGEWTARLAAESPGWPEKVTAFHPQMAVHGRHGQPCPVCGSPVQRIVYAENECNYCARCQTGGRLLADRALSRLLKASWPRTLDDG